MNDKTIIIYIGHDLKSVSRLGLTITVVGQLSIDEQKLIEDQYEDQIVDLIVFECRAELNSILVNDVPAYLITLEVYHPYPLLDVQASDSHLFPDSEDKFWIELKHYILIK
jgi:hypothetical protein